MKLYAIIWITKFGKLYAMEPIGIYKDMETALEYVLKLEQAWNKLGNDKYEEATFDIIDFKMDEAPYLLNYFTQMEEKINDTRDHHLSKLMKDGMVEQLVGEDGYFYYELTEKGEKLAKKKALFPQHVKDWKRFFGKGE
tara:strand:+ start:1634 stop:2050 length:417 start_codon:yes stop_codon:yes gene_type:complete